MEKTHIARIDKPIYKNLFAFKYLDTSGSAFRRYINRGIIYDKLRDMGYNKFQKRLTPQQANFLLRHLGITNDEL